MIQIIAAIVSMFVAWWLIMLVLSIAANIFISIKDWWDNY